MIEVPQISSTWHCQALGYPNILEEYRDCRSVASPYISRYHCLIERCRDPICFRCERKTPRRQERRRGRPRWPGRKLRPNSASSRSRNVGEPSGRPMVAAERYKPRPRFRATRSGRLVECLCNACLQRFRRRERNLLSKFRKLSGLLSERLGLYACMFSRKLYEFSGRLYAV